MVTAFYLNPNCHLDYVKQRAKDIMNLGHFNSLFLDVDAAAMAREDYRDNTSESLMLSAFNNRMQWLSDQPSLVLGSEDGNSFNHQRYCFCARLGNGWIRVDG